MAVPRLGRRRWWPWSTRAPVDSHRVSPRRRDPAHQLAIIGRSLLAPLEVGEVLEGVVRGMCEVSGRARSVVLSYDDQTQRLVGLAGHGVDPKDVRTIDIPVTAFVRRVIADGRTVVSDQPMDTLPEITWLLEEHGATGTLVVLPLRSETLGTMGVAFVEDGGRHFRLRAGEREALESFVGLAALAMQNAILAERSRRLAQLVAGTRAAESLHDSITQSLFGLRLGLDNLLADPQLPPALSEALGAIRDDAQTAVEALHEALRTMTEPDENARVAPPRSPLTEVRELAARLRSDHGLVGEVHVEGEQATPSAEASALLVRTVREGLTNIVKYADATAFSVHLRASSAWWTVEISDDGSGDPVAIRGQLARGEGGFGLSSLRAESQRLGGRSWVRHAPVLAGVALGVAVPTDAGVRPNGGVADPAELRGQD